MYMYVYIYIYIYIYTCIHTYIHTWILVPFPDPLLGDGEPLQHELSLSIQQLSITSTNI